MIESRTGESLWCAKVPEEDEEIDEEQAEALQEALEGDYEMGAAVRERVIPQAIKWFTGEALEDEVSASSCSILFGSSVFTRQRLWDAESGRRLTLTALPGSSVETH